MKIMMMNPASCLQTINLHFVNLFNVMMKIIMKRRTACKKLQYQLGHHVDDHDDDDDDDDDGDDNEHIGDCEPEGLHCARFLENEDNDGALAIMELSTCWI